MEVRVAATRLMVAAAEVSERGSSMAKRVPLLLAAAKP
jgi:hypothetical protein